MTTQRAAALPDKQPPTPPPGGLPPRANSQPFSPRAASQVTNRQLVAWMFQFLRPVRGLVILACLYLTLWVCAEIFTVRQAGEVANHIKTIDADASSADVVNRGFASWFFGNGPAPARLLR